MKKIKLNEKQKKVAVLTAVICAGLIGFAVLGGKESVPAVPPPSAAEAMAQAQATLRAKQDGASPSVSSATSAAPATAASILATVASATSAGGEPGALAGAPEVAVANAASVGGEPEVLAGASEAVPASAASASSPPLPAHGDAGQFAASGFVASSAPAVPVPAMQHPVALAAAIADPVPATMPAKTADYSGYYESMAVMQRQVQVLALRAKMAELQRQIDGPASGGGYPAPAAIMPPPIVPAPTTTAISTLTMTGSAPANSGPALSLSSIMMAGGRYQAVVRTGNANLTVMPGSSLTGGWLVDSITSSQVVIRRGKSRKTLTIGG